MKVILSLTRFSFYISIDRLPHMGDIIDLTKDTDEASIISVGSGSSTSSKRIISPSFLYLVQNDSGIGRQEQNQNDANEPQ